MDLFSPESFHSFEDLDFRHQILDEISLEGLDGITLQALWLRLSKRPSYQLGVEGRAKELVWEVVRKLKEVELYRLPTPRNDLVIYNRYEHMDEDLGIVIEPDDLPEDIYPFCLVDTMDQGVGLSQGVKGSCPTFHTRTKIENVLSLAEAEELGGSLVMVASQEARAQAILADKYDFFMVQALSAMQWIILERIGRSRYLGEVTQGALSLQFTKESPKTLFYHRKTLLRNNLITKQIHNQRSLSRPSTDGQKMLGQNIQGSLFHLPRFFTERRDKASGMAHDTIELLLSLPGGMATYEMIKTHLDMGSSSRKFFRSPIFLRFMKTDHSVPYRAIFPDAPDKQWKSKQSGTEKVLKTVMLIDENTRPDDVFKEDEVEEAGDVEDQSPSKDIPLGILDQSGWALDRTTMWQAYRMVEKGGVEGLTQHELGRLLGQGRLESRTICRNLVRRNVVFTVMKDVRRQRVAHFVATKFQDHGGHTNKLLKEMKKKEALTIASPEKEAPPPPPKKPPKPRPPTKVELKKAAVAERRRIRQEKKLGKLSKKGVAVEEKDSLAVADNDIEERTISPQRRTERRSGRPPSRQDVDVEDAVPADEKDLSCAAARDQEKKGSEEDELEEDMEVEQLNTEEREGEEKEQQETEQKETAGDNGAGCRVHITTNFASNATPANRDRKTAAKVARRSAGRDAEYPATYRQLKRANIILTSVRQLKVIDDPTKLVKLILAEEKKEGIQEKMDKKSMMRILEKLGSEGQIKNITAHLVQGNKSKRLHFVCEPDIDETNPVIQSAIEQAKMRFNIQRASPPLPEDTHRRHRKAKEVSLGEEETTEDPETTGRLSKKKYGVQPKFVKMRELHSLLFYLTHCYAGQPDLDQKQLLERLIEEGLLKGEEKAEVARMGRIYTPEPAWNMFISPLPLHTGWTDSWCLMGDVLLRLPLSIFVKIVNFGVEIPGLDRYLGHPILRHCLVWSLPQAITTKLLARRKYVFSVHEVACRLAYIGLLQFGPQRLKEKDQVFVYLNRRAILLDTTTSGLGYHQVERKEYVVNTYELTSLADLEQFWWDMHEICVNTPLGGSSLLHGQEITMEVLDLKPALISALKPVTASEAPERDIGYIPGDQLGAAGYDSALFAYLKRNWTWNMATYSKQYVSGNLSIPTGEPSSSSSSSAVAKKPKDAKKILVYKVPNKALENRGKKRRRKSKEEEEGEGGEEEVRLHPRARRAPKFTRVVGRKKTNPERKPYYDEKDKAALRLMRKLRVDWSTGEDSFLLLCKVAGSFLLPNSRYQMVPQTMVRDILHQTFPESANKTSRACQRRIHYMLRNKTTMDNVALYLADLEQNEELCSQFPDRDRASIAGKNRQEYEAQQEKDFTHLVMFMLSKYRKEPNQQFKLILPDTRQEIEQKYIIVHPTEESTPSQKHGFHEPRTTSDIHAGVVNSVIMSSLCSASDKRSWTFQLFKIYQQYPDQLLRQVMATLRENKMVALKKNYKKKSLKRGQYLPLSSCPYQLSVTFSHTFLNRYQYDIYSQSWQMLKLIAAQPHTFTDIVVSQEGGYAATVMGLVAKNKLLFRTEVPEQLVVLDPHLAAVDENCVRIFQRYTDLLKTAGGLQDMVDIETLKPASQMSIKDLFRKPKTLVKRHRKNQRRDSDSEEDIPAGEEEPEPFNRISSGVGEEGTGSEQAEQQQTVAGQDNKNMIVFQVEEGADNRSATTVARSASRIALYLMREDMRENPMDRDVSNPVQHAHDFFVISSCAVQAMLLPSTSQASTEEDRIVKYGQLTARQSDLPGDLSVFQDILSRYGLEVTGAVSRSNRGHRSACVPFTCPPLEDLCTELRVGKTWHKKDIEQFCVIVNLVEAAGELGLSRRDLKAKAGTLSLPAHRLEEGLTLALGEHLLLEVGIAEGRFVHHKHCRAWLLHTYKMTRMNIDSLPETKYAGKLYEGNGDEDIKETALQDANFVTVETVQDDNMEVEEPESAAAASVPSDTDSTSTGQQDIRIHHKRRPQSLPRVSREVCEGAEKVDWSKMEEVLVRIRPWIRMDGSLNRRVLDRLLGALLGYIMERPGLSLSSLTTRYGPALQPFHVRELLLLLEEMGAVRLNKLAREETPCSLWSAPPSVALVPISLLHEDEEVIVEANVDAILILGMFIGDKAYQEDFVGFCPCHPERRM